MSDDWDISTYLPKLYPVKLISLEPSFSCGASAIHEDSEVTDEILDECYVLIAQAVTLYGERYLPIFERIHEEREVRRKQKELLARVASVVKLDVS